MIRPSMRVETLALTLATWFTIACNSLFWKAALGEQALFTPDTLTYATALAVLLTSIHFVLLLLLLSLIPRAATKGLLTALTILTAVATYFMQAYHVHLDPEMVRNVLHTDPHEAGELLTSGMVLPIAAYLLPPLALIVRCDLQYGRLLPALGVRMGSVLVALLVAGAAMMLSFQNLSSFMRTHKEARYLITPANYLYSTVRTIISDGESAQQPRQPIGTDAQAGAGWTSHTKPALFIVVVGETLRDANWGLSGYERTTTPKLAAIDVINFPKVSTCGTNTEVSLPCMLAPVGRRAYDEKKIRTSESLPHVLAHAGFRVAWLDNQSGCKGTCDGLEQWRPEAQKMGADCPGGECFDNVLVTGMRQLTEGRQENTVLFLHMIGNHGPNYAKRYPAEFRRFTPTCDTADLGRCTQQEIMNSYDNGVLYTDHVLAEAIAFLETKQATHDTALIFIPDHGESLGENGLFLHGMPYAIAPAVQKEVPMILWLSGHYRASFNVNTDCLQTRRSQRVVHDHLFHTVLGLLNIQTNVYERQYDLSSCLASG